MSLAERLFGATRKRWRRRGNGGAPSPHAVHFAAVEERLRLVAALVAGRFVEVRQAEGPGKGASPTAAGGVSARSLWLPVSMGEATDIEANQNAYLARTVVGARMLALGFGAAAPSLRPHDRTLGSILCLAPTLASLREDWPGALPLVRATPLPTAHHPLACLELAHLSWAPDQLAERFGAALAQWAIGSVDAQVAPRQLAAHAQRCREALSAIAVDTTSKPYHPAFGQLRVTTSGENATDLAALPPSRDGLPTGSERQGRSREQVEHVEANREQDGDSPLAHVFEKLFTAEEYQGGNRRMDGSDELEEHGDAIDELNIRQVMRTAETTQSVYRADLELEGTAPELTDGPPAASVGIPYDEWDVDRRKYRRDWCTLYAQPPETPLARSQSAAYMLRFRRHHHRTIKLLTAEMQELNKRQRPRPRQPVGAEIDIDAVVALHGDTIAARGGARKATDANRADRTIATSDRLYLSRRRPTPELATLLLLDISMSSDSWTDGKRVLDIAKTSLLILGEVFESLGMPFAVGGFFSNSRRDCRYVQVKGFTDGWPLGTANLLGLRPTGYTRIGPALRHGIGVLRQAPAKHRLLLLLSDGKPTDFDAYEGKHGIGDVRQALNEAAAQGVSSFALAVEASARHYLPRMFGRGGFEILTDPATLPDKAIRVCRRVLR